MIVSLLINRKGTRAKGFWRFCFVLSCAVPMFVSLLIMRTMLQPEGAVNVLLRNIGLIAPDASLPFFTDPTWARVTVIVVNIWVGVPYTLLQLTGVLQNIPAELYEAARVDGANTIQIFFKITLPYMLYVTTPYLISTFTGNVNNFNVIYLLSGGDPVTNLSSTAGSTDLLVTWLYKLTIDRQYYNVGSVIGILTFIILAVGALLTYRNSKSYMLYGIVHKVGYDKRSGIFVILRHGDITVSYCHLSKVAVRKGDVVSAGTVVGVTGNTGRSTGEHLHIICKLRGKHVDPMAILRFLVHYQK